MSDCDATRSAITARLAGTEPLTRPSRIAEHLDGCKACRDWEAEAMAEHHRSTERLREAVLAHPASRTGSAKGSSKGDTLRYVLGAVAGTEIVLALIAILMGTQLHPARELAAADFAFAVGCLAAAIQPTRSLGIWPVGAAVLVLVVGTGVFDLLSGVSGPLSESHHALEVAAAVLRGLLARQTNRGHLAR